MRETSREVLVRCCWLFALVAAAATSTGAEAEELDRVLPAWERSAPTALQADRSGPFWARRLDDRTIVLERLAADRRSIREVRQVDAPVAHPAKFFIPDLVKGLQAPELFYRAGSRLRAELDSSVASTLGEAQWEGYAAGRNASTLLAVGFGLREVQDGDGEVKYQGFSAIALTGGGDRPLYVEMPGGAKWAPQALVSSTHAYVLYRSAAGSLLIESMAIDMLRRKRRWEPTVQEFKSIPDEFGNLDFSNPRVCLDDAGALHWASPLWYSIWGVPSGRIVVDGIELEHRGLEERVDWRPDLACVSGRGLVLTMVGTSGAVEVGEVHGNQFELLAELPSVAPAYGEAPPTYIASYGASFYVSTSEGLWAFEARVPTAVPVWSAGMKCLVVVALALAGSLCTRRRRGPSRESAPKVAPSRCGLAGSMPPRFWRWCGKTPQNGRAGGEKNAESLTKFTVRLRSRR